MNRHVGSPGFGRASQAQPASLFGSDRRHRERPGTTRARAEDRLQKRRAAERHGRIAEWVAAITLMLRGYRIIARRLVTPCGEIDLVGVRGRRLAFVEVKQRPDRQAAEIAFTDRQTRRLHAAAAQFVAGRPRFRHHERGFDSIAVVPWRLPLYAPDALQPPVMSATAVWG